MDSQKKKILIVDDDEFLLDMYAMRFSQNNFDVHVAHGSLEAITLLKAGLNPEILLTDVIMPDLNGFELLEKVNAENMLPPNAVKIVLTNKNSQDDFDKGQSLGAKGYIVKASSTPGEVVTQVLNMIDAKDMIVKH